MFAWQSKEKVMRSRWMMAVTLAMAVGSFPAWIPQAAAQALVGPGTGAVQSMAPAERQYVVFFSEWSAALDEAASRVVRAAVLAAAASPAATIVVTGTADPVGSARANTLISALRAEQVFDALVAAGVTPGRIERRALGGTDYVMSAQEARRVTIAIGPK